MSKNDDTDDKLERILSEIGPRPSYKLAIKRAEPKWCAGYLGTIDVHVEEDASWENIRAEWGGGLFYIKILDGYGRYQAHNSIKIAGEPMKNGRRLHKHPEQNPYWVPSSPQQSCECDSLREEIAELTDKLEKLEDRQEQAVEMTEQEDDDEHQQVIEIVDENRGEREYLLRQILAKLNSIGRAVSHIEKLGGLAMMGLGIFVLKSLDKE